MDDVDLLFELQFFPKTEKYVALFMGGDDRDIVDRRNRLRKQIKANIIAAAASGKDLEGIHCLSLIPITINCRILLFFYFYRAWDLVTTGC